MDQGLKDSLKVFQMIIPASRVDQNIVEEDQDKPSQERLENRVHETLKG